MNKLWKSAHPEKLPDFIIGGAMKSGTTTLHAILHKHPQVEIAKEELGFFDMDDILQHQDFNKYDRTKQRWITQSMLNNSDKLWNWYYEHFRGLMKNNNIVGEDSTTYLASEMAAQRIALQSKPIKLIFILRHPTDRTISNYLHALKSGRTIYSLEDTLRYNPSSIINRSLYKQHLEIYYRHHTPKQIHVCLFEDMIADKSSFFRNICEFLELDFSLFQTEDFDTHVNKTKISTHLNLQRLRNRYLYKLNDYRYSKNLPVKLNITNKAPWSLRFFNKVHSRINPHKENQNFEVSKSTREFLDNYFKTRLHGIDELISQNIMSKWF